MAKMVECATDPPLAAFQKLCPRTCKLLNNQNFMAKASLLAVVASLSQEGAIAPQSLESLRQSIHERLGSTDWMMRKAATDITDAITDYSAAATIGFATAAQSITPKYAAKDSHIKLGVFNNKASCYSSSCCPWSYVEDCAVGLLFALLQF
ncbi:microtubule-associated protein TORTIFOLIA1-like isoform X2 [Durio zibethinus]|uniref:Microtubule-associated protein TORTIFOLIA1-like isoform X2 n=1 Tax=Durio zibethinus TaxID=66656 RepID=A0A6P5X3C6_DURZI|nr:microtubule-associated protein TORTIFOLIA1-like isoform X2 [Durio zibethinus]